MNLPSYVVGFDWLTKIRKASIAWVMSTKEIRTILHKIEWD